MDEPVRQQTVSAPGSIDAEVERTRADVARRRPIQVRWAQWLMYVGAALVVLRSVATWARADGTTSMLAGSLLWAAAIAGVWLVLAGCVGAGMNWARWLVSVLAVLSAVTTVMWFLDPFVEVFALQEVLALTELLIAVGILVLVWMRPAREFFRAAGLPG